MDWKDTVFDFLEELIKLPPKDDPGEEAVIRKAADALNIAVVDIVEYASASDEVEGREFSQYTFYDCGKEKGELAITSTNPRVIGGTFTYRAFPVKDTMWTIEDMKAVSAFIHILSLRKGNLKIFERLDYLTYHDIAFGMHNVMYGERVMCQLINQKCIDNYASVFMNFRNMTEINENLGRDLTTGIMQLYCAEFQKILTPPECFWRHGGDNFGALIRKEHVEKFTELIKGADIRYGDRPRDVVRMSACAGIYMIDSKETTSSALIDHCSQTMLIARYAKHAPYLFYDEETLKISEQSKSMEAHFEEALGKGEFIAYYQPKVSLSTGLLSGAEALCRWKRADELIPPAAFIPVFERSKRICEIDFAMLKTVCSDLAKWKANGYSIVPVSVNFSRKHLSNNALARDIMSIVKNYDLKPENIIIEFTETTSEEDQKRLKETVENLKKMGFCVSVDDFGIGYSSLSMIRDIHFDELKIDKSFLDTDGENYERKLILMKHVLGLAEEFNMSTIAEGAETIEQVKLLDKIGCKQVQGYYFDKPMPPELFENRLKNPKYELN